MNLRREVPPTMRSRLEHVLSMGDIVVKTELFDMQGEIYGNPVVHVIGPLPIMGTTLREVHTILFTHGREVFR